MVLPFTYLEFPDIPKQKDKHGDNFVTVVYIVTKI